MSFLGGGTDLPQFFNEYGGAVISTTFDKYCYVIVRHLPPFHDYQSELVYSKIERVHQTEEIQHPAIREAMKMLDMHDLRLSYEGDLPARTGLGTSSSFAVGMLNAFYSLKGKFVDKHNLATDAIHLERDLCQELGGWQDQIAAAYGNLNRIDFFDNQFTVTPIIIHPERKVRLNESLHLFYTGRCRLSSTIQQDSFSNLQTKQSILKQTLQLVDEAQRILSDKHGDLDDFGRLLHEAWNLKKTLGDKITDGTIDAIYQEGLKAGAIGGKLLGAGGGGFLLFYCPPEKKESLRNALRDYLYIPFKFEEKGTTVIHYSPESYIAQ